MALGDNATTQSRRNLWIILGSCLGAFVIAIILTIVFLCRKRLQRRGLIPTRTITPLGDAEFESWRRPSVYTSRPERYTIISKPQPIVTRSEVNSVAIFDGERRSIEKRAETPPSPRSPTSPNFSRPRTPRQTSAHKSHLSRNSSIYSLERPPTPYSPSRSEKDDRFDDDIPASPKMVAKPKKALHHHYPSVSEVSDFDFDIEKRPLTTYASRRQSQPYEWDSPRGDRREF